MTVGCSGWETLLQKTLSLVVPFSSYETLGKALPVSKPQSSCKMEIMRTPMLPNCCEHLTKEHKELSVALIGKLLLHKLNTNFQHLSDSRLS